MKNMRIIISTLALGLLANTALAGPNCTCRFAGQNYKTGDIMCIRGKLSKCDFVLNNTSWKTIAETCPQTNLQQNLQTPGVKTQVSLTEQIRAKFSIQ